MRRIILLLAVLGLLTCCSPANDTAEKSVPEKSPLPGEEKTAAYDEAPVKGMVTMIDLGADKCIPCKMMAPILKEVEREYRGKAAVIFFDVWKDPAPAKRFGIRAIPTQIFFDSNGAEILRHEGFLDKKNIKAIFAKLGVKP